MNYIVTTKLDFQHFTLSLERYIQINKTQMVTMLLFKQKSRNFRITYFVTEQ